MNQMKFSKSQCLHLLSAVKEQNPMSEFEDLVGFNQQFTNWAPSYSASRRVLQGLSHEEGFYRRQRVAGKSLAKEKKDIFVGGGKNGKGFII